MNRTNPCVYRYGGCLADVREGARACENCRIEHNAREAKRRKSRRRKGGCWVCGEPVRLIDGKPQRTCERHEHYRAEMTP